MKNADRVAYATFITVLALLWTSGCSAGPDCKDLLLQADDALARCGIIELSDGPQQCTEDVRRGLECWISCIDAANCDALGGNEGAGEYNACVIFCETFVSVPALDDDQ
jgi:hypothetical protein